MPNKPRIDREHEETDHLDWAKPGAVNQAWAAIRASIDEMSRTPGSRVAMCLTQSKTTVGLQEDGKSLVEHALNVTITLTSLEPC